MSRFSDHHFFPLKLSLTIGVHFTSGLIGEVTGADQWIVQRSRSTVFGEDLTIGTFVEFGTGIRVREEAFLCKFNRFQLDS